MKGAGTPIIAMIGVLLLAAIFFWYGDSTVNGLIEDKTAATYMAAMGMRNAIIELSLSERGTAIYKTPDSERYTFTIDSNTITALYKSTESPGKPRVSIRHYTPELVLSSPLIGNEFCIVVKRDSTCKKIVEVCAAGAACCAMDNNVCW